jgi:hypothetical protein
VDETSFAGGTVYSAHAPRACDPIQTGFVVGYLSSFERSGSDYFGNIVMVEMQKRSRRGMERKVLSDKHAED